MIHTIEVAPHITLRCFSDDRFKQEGLSLTLVRPMCREEAALNALLPAVLLRGSRSAPDLRAITQRLDDLYGASVGSQLRRVGDYQTTGLSCSFMKERFALENDKVFDPMIDFLQELEEVVGNGEILHRAGLPAALHQIALCLQGKIAGLGIGTGMQAVETGDIDALIQLFQQCLLA
jgi:hypothetical protein